MKRIVRKNQVIITSLVIMILVAGYLNFTAERVTTETSTGTQTTTQQVDDLGNISEGTADGDMTGEDSLVDVDVVSEEGLEDVMGASAASAFDDGLTENGDAGDELAENDGTGVEDVDHIGEAVLTSTNSAAAMNFCSSARLSREQARSKNKETLLEVINNDKVAEDIRQNASNELMELTSIAEKELAAETMLEAKGFANSVVSITDECVDVVICMESIDDSQKAQIEDIVVRKTESSADQIVITTLKSE